jgi:class 3 adenylate cyclase/tetratricopeptide (TPR) repeat protein
VICPVCQTANEEDANFCFNCNHRLVVVCPRCSRRVHSRANYCDRCGLALNTPYRVENDQPESQPATTLKRVDEVAAQPSKPAGQPVGAPPPAEAKRSATQAPAVESALAQYIPAELMRKLEMARTSGEMVGERRVVTMMFCDVKGSTAAAEQLDPEEWSEIINGAFEHMIRPVYTYEGTVARLMGDSILAFFGAPLAHEDDPQRAVLAGLDILANMTPYREKLKQSWGIDVNVRVGINTGLVVVGAVGSDLRMEYTALGDAINLAARMEQTAEPGTVQIAEETYKLVRHLFEFETLPPIEVKGKAESVQAYRVLARRAVAGRVRGIEGLHAEMVGREAELATFKRIIVDLKQGVGRIVSVLGEAGLGKSRLVGEAKDYFEDLPGPDCNWYETVSLSYETHNAYGLLRRLIRLACDIHYEDTPPAVQEKLATITDALPEENRVGARRLLDVMFGLAAGGDGVPLEEDTFKDELFEVLETWLRARFASQPTVLVFDDMHWGDSASVDAIRRILPLTAELPLVIVAVMREERQAPAWQIITTADEEYHHRYTQITLRPLTESESNELISRLLAIAEIPAGLRANILEKSDGNPFFIEEVVRTLIENGIVVCEDREVNGATARYWRATSDGAGVSIPNTLRALLSARMDRLEEATKATLQIASVIGRSFYLRVLQAVDQDDVELPKHLATLERLEMVRESARVPEVEYAFRNPLTQEAVYRTILLKHRREFHRRVGEVLEDLYASRLEGLYGLLAHHFTLAGEQDRAIHYCRLAADQAIAVYAYDEAAQNLQTAVELLSDGTSVDVRLALFEKLGDVYRLMRDFAPAIINYQQALDLHEAAEDADRLVTVRLHRKIVTVATDTKWSVNNEAYAQISAASESSVARLIESLAALEGRPPHRETVLLLIALSVDAWRVQMPPAWDDAQQFAESAVNMSGALDDPVLLSKALGALANVLDGQSHLRRHYEVARRRLALTQEGGFADASERIDALRGAGLAHMYVGEYTQALPYLEEAEGMARRMRAVDQIANVVGIRAQCFFRSDQWDDVLAMEKVWRDLEEKYPRRRTGETCFFVALSAAVYSLRGDHERARIYAEESYNYMLSMSGVETQWQRNQFY